MKIQFTVAVVLLSAEGADVESHKHHWFNETTPGDVQGVLQELAVFFEEKLILMGQMPRPPGIITVEPIPNPIYEGVTDEGVLALIRNHQNVQRHTNPTSVEWSWSSKALESLFEEVVARGITQAA